MKSIITKLIIFVSPFIFWGCNDHPKSEEHTTDVAVETAKPESSGISLNNGEKWKVNEEMKPFILDAETILADYNKNNSTDYKTLGASLKEKNSGLINSCTMTGESHDALHKWLHPHMELIESLNNTENEEEAKTIIAKLNESFQTFHQYFQ